MLWLLFADKHILHFVVLKVHEMSRLLLLFFIIIKERLIMLVATFRGFVPTFILPTHYAGKQLLTSDSL